MPRSVQYSRNGGPEVLDVVTVDAPHPGPGQVRVHVRTAGLNPLDYKLFRGMQTAAGTPAKVPSGNGHDYAGEIDELGEGVAGWQLGEAVFGQAVAAQADFILVAADQLTRKPDELSFEIAGALGVVGRTASASVASLNLTPDDTVFVSAAAGGVGALAAQLALRTGARVIGSASPANHDFLVSLGVTPVEYGPGLVEALTQHGPITAALDNNGRESVDAALAAGAPASRVNSIADYKAAADYGTTAVGGRFATPDALATVADLIVAGEVQLPIEAIFALERVREAYELLIAGHLRGKVVLALS